MSKQMPGAKVIVGGA